MINYFLKTVFIIQHTLSKETSVFFLPKLYSMSKRLMPRRSFAWSLFHANHLFLQLKNKVFKCEVKKLFECSKLLLCGNKNLFLYYFNFCFSILKIYVLYSHRNSDKFDIFLWFFLTNKFTSGLLNVTICAQN